MTLQGDLKVTLCIHVDERLQGQCLVNKCEYRSRFSGLYMPNEDLNE